ncbi:hypothetical protein [Oscillibacter sp.]|uniref:hypothetical protein n=1 Tax=Oscillibacter sp. TaxID=1945593 RepID=UPI00257A2174|nr:hypothetical protein [Oscillibacter sp.]
METSNSFLDIIITETDRMTHIVQDPLTLSRLDAGNAELVLSRFPSGTPLRASPVPMPWPPSSTGTR